MLVCRFCPFVFFLAFGTRTFRFSVNMKVRIKLKLNPFSKASTSDGVCSAWTFSEIFAGFQNRCMDNVVKVITSN